MVVGNELEEGWYRVDVCVSGTALAAGVDLVVYRQYRSKSSGAARAARCVPVKRQALTGRLAPFRFMESPSLNGIAFTAQPQAPAGAKAGAFGWAVIVPVRSGVSSLLS